MCRVLKISRSSYYYKPVKKENTDILEHIIRKIFKDIRNNYGLQHAVPNGETANTINGKNINAEIQ